MDEIALAGRTAIGRGGRVSVPVRMICERSPVSGRVLHYGSGHASADTAALGQQAFAVEWDPNWCPHEDALQSAYDVVVSVYVLNVLPPLERQACLEEIRRLAPRALLAVRADRNHLHGEPEADGVRTSRQTFQRAYTADELRDELTDFFRPSTLCMLTGDLCWRIVPIHNQQECIVDPGKFKDVAARMACYKKKQQRKAAAQRKPTAPAKLQGGVTPTASNRPIFSLRDLRDMFYLETPLSHERDGEAA